MLLWFATFSFFKKKKKRCLLSITSLFKALVSDRLLVNSSYASGVVTNIPEATVISSSTQIGDRF